MKEREKVIESLYGQIRRLNDGQMLRGTTGPSPAALLEPSFGHSSQVERASLANTGGNSGDAVEEYLKQS